MGDKSYSCKYIIILGLIQMETVTQCRLWIHTYEKQHAIDMAYTYWIKRERKKIVVCQTRKYICFGFGPITGIIIFPTSNTTSYIQYSLFFAFVVVSHQSERAVFMCMWNFKRAFCFISDEICMEAECRTLL